MNSISSDDIRQIDPSSVLVDPFYGVERLMIWVVVFKLKLHNGNMIVKNRYPDIVDRKTVFLRFSQLFAGGFVRFFRCQGFSDRKQALGAVRNVVFIALYSAFIKHQPTGFRSKILVGLIIHQ